MSGLPESLATTGSHAVAVVIAFVIITALHIVLGELTPKGLALQRSEGTALLVVRPLGLFLFLLWPAIITLNGLGNLLLRLCGLRPGTGEESLHSPEELKLLVAASQEGGLLNQAQQEVVERVFNIGDRRIADIMTARVDVDWIDADDPHEEILRTIRECRHEQLLVGRGNIDEPVGMILKKDLLDQVLDGKSLDPMAVIREPLIVNETASIFRVLDQFKKAPVRLAMVIDEYGSLDGIITQTDLLEAIAGDLPDTENEEPDLIECDDGSLLIDGRRFSYDCRVRPVPARSCCDAISGSARKRRGQTLVPIGRLAPFFHRPALGARVCRSQIAPRNLKAAAASALSIIPNHYPHA